MIALTVCCDVPSCANAVTRSGASVHLAPGQLADLLHTALTFGWWTDDLGRAWCPDHQAKPDPTGSPNA